MKYKFVTYAYLKYTDGCFEDTIKVGSFDTIEEAFEAGDKFLVKEARDYGQFEVHVTKEI